jgi:hypothetical protein
MPKPDKTIGVKEHKTCLKGFFRKKQTLFCKNSEPCIYLIYIYIYIHICGISVHMYGDVCSILQYDVFSGAKVNVNGEGRNAGKFGGKTRFHMFGAHRA